MNQTKSILFVCWGNVCRSAAAEIILKRQLDRLGIGGLRIESAGVCADADVSRPSFSMWWATLFRGFWLRPNPTLFRSHDISRFDLVIAMDREVLFSINSIATQTPANVKLLSEFLPGEWPVDVPDPMNRSVAVCKDVLDMLSLACSEISKQLSPTATKVEAAKVEAAKVEAGLQHSESIGDQLRVGWLESSSVC